MLENITVNWQSSICIETRDAVLYLDPWQLKEEIHDADIICISHKHFDHFSPEDIEKIKKEDTILIAPASIRDEITQKSGISEENTVFVKPGEQIHFGDITITGIPAYNTGKIFHMKRYGWLGFLIEADGTRYYYAGDTDVNDDIRKVRCDVALIPIGGHYTMNSAEAAELINEIAPEYAIPIHYGCVDGAGNIKDEEDFARRISEKTEVILKLHQ